MSVSAQSAFSAAILPTTLIAWEWIYGLGWLTAWSRACMEIGLIRTAATGSFRWLVSSSKICRGTGWGWVRVGMSIAELIFFSSTWLASIQYCCGSFSTIFRISNSFPITLLPATMIAISLISLELLPKYTDSSSSNCLTTPGQFSYCFQSTAASIHNDSYKRWGSRFPSSSRARQIPKPDRRQKEILSRSGFGFYRGIQACVDRMICSLTSAEYHLKQSSYSSSFRRRWKIWARDIRRSCLALSFTFCLSISEYFYVWN